MSGSQIDTEVKGSVSSVEHVAHWLRDVMKPKLDEAATQTVNARRRGQDDWLGDSGDAYARVARDVVLIADNAVERASIAARKIEAYSDRLRTCKERMADARRTAAGGGLTVTGTIIHPPTDTSDAKYVDKVTLYNQVVSDVNHELESFTDWIATNLRPVPQALEDHDAHRIRETLLEFANSAGIGASLDFSKEKLRDRVKELNKAREEVHRWRRSGNPARRAANRAAEESGALEELGKFAKWFGRGAKALGVLGTVIELGEGMTSDHPVGGTAAALLGIGATAVAGIGIVALSPVELPTLAVVGGAAIVGTGIAWLGDKAWEALPDDWTDPADHAMKHVVDEAEDKIGDGWHKVTGWI